MKKQMLAALGAMLFAAPALFAGDVDLSGRWSVRMAGNTDDPQAHSIMIPGTLSDARLGPAATAAVYGALTPRRQYIGKAVYTRTFCISAAQQCDSELVLGRVLWKSTVSLDGTVLGSCDSLATPHVYRVPAKLLTPGRHTLTVEVDNSMIYPIGEKAHSYGDSMQTRWNGLLGGVTLRPYTPLRSARVFAPFGDKVRVELADTKGVTLSVKDTDAKEIERTATSVTLQVHGAKPWSYNTPHLYTLMLKDASGTTHDIRFGFRSFERKGNRLYMNGQPLFIRGNIENCHFPLTGYPATDKASWMKILKAQKDEGANQIRFHTWCPPPAAFEAADELGILLSPEANIWIDGWMTRDFPYLKGLGRGHAEVDAWVQAELRRILDVYGNSPSFYSLSIGNELGSADFGKLTQWMQACKDYDSRRLYAASTARTICPTDDFIVTHAYPGIGMVRERLNPGTDWDYQNQYRRTKVPTIAHEIGQWPVYPRFDADIAKYTGLLRPWNLEGLRERSEKADVLRLNNALAEASLRTNRLMYKAEIESFLRTPDCAGISLLGMQDYSGQGEALIGWLDSFYDPKPGLAQAVPVKHFFDDTVCLTRFAKDTWTTDETLTVTFQVHNYGPDMEKQPVRWSFAGQEGTVDCTVPSGTVTTVAVKQFPLKDLQAPARHTLTFGKNRWNLWVYPSAIEESIPSGVTYTNDFAEAVAALKRGRRVLLNASAGGNPKQTVHSAFRPVYWSTTWFPGQRACTLGMLVDDRSAAFASFPTENWQDWQWYHLVNSAKTFRLDGFPKGYTPLAMPVMDFHKPALLGMIFEVSVGKGRLLVSGVSLDAGRSEARQLKRSLLDYVASDAFRPTAAVSEKMLAGILEQPRRKVAPRPAEFADAVAYIECGAFLGTMNRDVGYARRQDRAEFVSGTHQLTGTNLRLWGDKDGRYWVASTLNLTLENLSPVRGRIRIRFRDPNSNGRTAKGTFEGRPFTVPAHAKNPGGSYWVDLPVDMEDFLDGRLEITAECVTGPNLQIDRVVVIPNKE